MAIEIQQIDTIIPTLPSFPEQNSSTFNTDAANFVAELPGTVESINSVVEGMNVVASGANAVAALLDGIDSESVAANAALAEESAAAAVAAAASTNLPSITSDDAGKSIVVKTDGSGYKVGSIFSNPNLLPDGEFNIWIEGTSQTTSGYGSDTLCKNLHNGSTKTHSRQSFVIGDESVPFEFPSRYYSRTAVTSVTGTGNYVYKQFFIPDITLFSSKLLTLSLLARASAATHIAVELEAYFGTGGSPSSNVTGIGSQLVTVGTSFSRQEANITVPSFLGKTLGTDGNNCLFLNIWFDAGSNFNTRTASLGQQGGNFDIAQVKLEYGGVRTPIIPVTEVDARNRAYRFYENGIGRHNGYQSSGFDDATTINITPKWRTPTVSSVTTNSSNISAYSLTALNNKELRDAITAASTGQFWRDFTYIVDCRP